MDGEQPTNFPPVGLFGWHYTQGILEWFTTAQFQGLEQVYF
jgi:hypothetical protein